MPLQLTSLWPNKHRQRLYLLRILLTQNCRVNKELNLELWVSLEKSHRNNNLKITCFLPTLHKQLTTTPTLTSLWNALPRSVSLKYQARLDYKQNELKKPKLRECSKLSSLIELNSMKASPTILTLKHLLREKRRKNTLRLSLDQREQTFQPSTCQYLELTMCLPPKSV